MPWREASMTRDEKRFVNYVVDKKRGVLFLCFFVISPESERRALGADVVAVGDRGVVGVLVDAADKELWRVYAYDAHCRGDI